MDVRKLIDERNMLISTAGLQVSLLRLISYVNKAALGGVELSHSDLRNDVCSPIAIRSASSEQGTNFTYRGIGDFEGSSRSMPASFEHAENILENMQILQAEILLIRSNTRTDASDDLDEISADLWMMSDLASSYDCRLTYSAHRNGRWIHTAEKALEVVLTVNHPSIGINVELGAKRPAWSDHLLSQIPIDKIFSIRVFGAIADVNTHGELADDLHQLNCPELTCRQIKVLMDRGYNGNITLVH